MEASTEERPATRTNVGRIEEIQGVVIEAVFPEETPRDRRRHHAHARERRRPRLRGPAAPGRRPHPRGRDGRDGRPGPRHGGLRHRRPDHRPGRQRHARAHLQRPRRRDRRGRGRSRSRSAGRSTAPPRRSRTSPRPRRCSRPASRSSTSSRPTRRAARSACSAAPASARRSSSRSSSTTSPRSTAACPPSAALGERSAARATTSWLSRWPESGVIDKTHARLRPDGTPPGGRPFAWALSGLTMAEYFRDVEGQDVLLFIDNIFRFVQAGSEVSALLGRMPSQVGYQPDARVGDGPAPGADHVDPQGLRSPSIQAIYVPADDLTDPAPASVFAHLNATTTLSARDLPRRASYPAVDPLDSTSAGSSTRTSSARSTINVARA